MSYREFCEVVVRLAKSAFADGPPPDVPLRDPQLTDKQVRALEQAAADLEQAGGGGFGIGVGAPQEDGSRSLTGGPGSISGGTTSAAGALSVLLSAGGGSAAMASAILDGAGQPSQRPGSTLKQAKVDDMLPAVGSQNATEQPPQPSPLTGVHALPWLVDMYMWTRVRPATGQPPRPLMRGTVRAALATPIEAQVLLGSEGAPPGNAAVQWPAETGAGASPMAGRGTPSSPGYRDQGQGGGHARVPEGRDSRIPPSPTQGEMPPEVAFAAKEHARQNSAEAHAERAL